MPAVMSVDEYVAKKLAEPWPLSDEQRRQLARLLQAVKPKGAA